MKTNRLGVAGRLLSLLGARNALFGAALALLALPLSAATPTRIDPADRVKASSVESVMEIQASAKQQIQMLNSIKGSRNASQQKIDSRLFMGILNARNDGRALTLPDFRFVLPERDGRIQVEILTSSSSGMKHLLDELERVGAEVTWRSIDRTHLLANVPMLSIEEIAALAEVKRVRLPLPAMTNKINTSEGDRTHLVEQARGYFGVTGAGVKVCVISDGVDSLAALQASGDLPAVDVLPGQAGSGDEGSAMLEIVHDLAPNAELGFATALPNEATFAQNILDLAASGCDIIVDDIIYLAESPFQDGRVAQAVNTVTAAGVLYFSSAGNEGNKTDLTSGTWEGDFLPNGTPGILAGGGLAHNFGDGGQSIRVEFGNTQTPALLIWAEHYDLSTGSASTDYDLYVLNGGMSTVFDASTDAQDGVGGDDFPIEFIGGGAFEGERLVVMKFANGTTSSAPMFNLILFRGELDDALTTPGTTRGHSAAANAFSVAATPVADSFDGSTPDGPYPGPFTAANASESFSADGPRRIILGPTGNELTPGNRTSTGGVVRQKPDFTAADGVSTASPGFNPFYGTSAAAPHAAAIAALLKQADSSLTTAQIRAALVNSAIDIEAPGVDRDTGAGIIMAQAALEEIGAQPQAHLGMGAVVASEVVGDGDVFPEGNEDWSLVIPLQNVGGEAATGISATLSTTAPGVTIYAADSNYPDLAPTGSAPNATPYAFYIDPSQATCGSVVEFTLEVTYTGGNASPQTFTHDMQLGGPGAPVTYSYAGPVVPIPDGGDLSGNMPGTPAVVDLPVAASGSVYKVAMSIDGATCTSSIGSTTVGIDHTFVNDLELTLVSPSGAAVLVVNNTDGSGNNFCQTVLDDESGGPSIQSVVTSQAPFTGSFTPAAQLASLKGQDVSGTWQLRAQDFFASDSGNIRAWSLQITPAVCDAPPQVVALEAAKTVAGTFEEGGGITYTIEIENTGTGLQLDNPGDEFTDVLPAGLTPGVPTATGGTVALTGNTVTWNGSLAGGATVTITIPATINAGTAGQVISNQGSVSFDADRDGSNESSAPTDDPGAGGTADPTTFTVLQGQLSITPTLLAFGDVVVGTTSVAQAATLENTGDAALQVTSVGAPVAPFAQGAGSTCPAAPFTLGPGDSCTLAYTFAPTATGAAAGSIAVASNVPGGGSISLSGNGTQGQLSIASTLLAFGDVSVGTTSAAQTATLSNTGDAALQVTSIAAVAAPFAQDASSTCGAAPFTLAPGGSCMLAYTFAPVATGAASASVAITANAPGGGNISLTGNGVQGMLVVAPTTLDFGDVQVDTDSAVLDVTLTNNGSGGLLVTSFDTPTAPFARIAGGTCTALPITLAPGASCTVQFIFQPSVAGVASQMLDIEDDQGGAVTVTLTGNGTRAPLAVPRPVPALSTQGLLLAISLLALMGLYGIRRKM